MATLVEDPAGSGLFVFVDSNPGNPGVETGWHTLTSARDEWVDAPVSDSILSTLLEAAKDQCLSFAPALPADADTIPVRYRLAQVMQARNLWNAGKSTPSNDMGEGGYTVPIFPLDWHVKALLRPSRGLPVVA